MTLKLKDIKQKLKVAKKGQIELPFHLVFALIAGSVILLIFIIFAFKGYNVSKAEASIDISNTLNLLLTSTEVSPKTFLPIEDLPKSKLEFTCEDFSIGGQAKSYQNKIVFAPSQLETTKLFIWSFDWNAPFYVTNMIAITSPSVIYVFVGANNDPLQNSIQSAFPKNITARFVENVATFPYTGHEYARFVFVNPSSNIALPQSFANKKVSALKIVGTLESGTIDFYKNDFKKPLLTIPAEYYGSALLFGAIFTDNAETYTCNIGKAINRLKNIAKIYEKKQEILRGNIPGGRICTYNAPIKELITITGQDFLITTIENIRKTNKVLQQQSCPVIY